MKDKICIFKAEGDISDISADICDGIVTLRQTEDDELTVTMPAAKNVHAACDGGTLYISQPKGCSCPFAARQRIDIAVPQHIVPTLTVNAKRVELHIDSGIYGETEITADSGAVYISGADAQTVSINGGKIKANIEDSTIKGRLYVNARNAEFLAQHAFAGVAVVRTKKGNMGIVALHTRDCTLETEEGNITATIVGRKQNFNLNLTANGVPEEQCGDKHARNSLSAYTKKGSIICEFVEDDGAADEIEEDVAFAEEVAEEQVAVEDAGTNKEI